MIQCNKDGPLPVERTAPISDEILRKASCRITIFSHSRPSGEVIYGSLEIEKAVPAPQSGMAGSWAPGTAK